jgi:hypothetical protein
MLFSFLASSLALHAGLAFADEPPTPEPSVTVPQQLTSIEASHEEMIVIGKMRVAKTRAMVEIKLKRMGYHSVNQKNGRTIIRHRAAHKPTIIVDDDGWVRLKRSPIKIDPPGKKDSKLRYLWCLPPFTITPACIKAGGQLIHRRRHLNHKDRVLSQIKPYLREWTDAVIDHAMDARLTEGIPDMLDAIWAHGTPEQTDTPPLPTPSARREAILHFWASRSCTKEGEQARVLASDFFNETIQNSPNPANFSEIAATNTAQRCPDAKRLPNPYDH